MAFHRRIKKELDDLHKKAPPGISLDESSIKEKIDCLVVHMEGAEGTLYSGEKFKLQFKFTDKYPFDSPGVTFIGKSIPLHPHVYSNGHICLSILADDWSPALTILSVCVSIQSMLSSCEKKESPPDNDMYVRFGSRDPKKTRWYFHDDGI
jgi:ubiquitin-conjugating enzyme E2 W